MQRRTTLEVSRKQTEHSRAFGLAIAQKLREGGHLVAFDGRLNVLDFQDLRIRLRLLWPTIGEVGQVWRIRVERG